MGRRWGMINGRKFRGVIQSTRTDRARRMRKSPTKYKFVRRTFP